MNKNKINLIYIFLIFSVLYFVMPLKALTMAFFIVLAGFYYARWFKISIFISSFISCGIVIYFFKEYPFFVLTTCVIFVLLLPLPYYFHIKLRNLKEKCSVKSKIIKVKLKTVVLKYKKSLKEKEKYENNVERIIQLYILCKKLSKCVSKKEYTKTILDVFKQRTDIVGCSIYEKVEFEWRVLAASGTLCNRDLVPYIHSLKFLGRDKKYNIINHKEFNICKMNIIYWPLKIENQLLGCILIAVKKDGSDKYLAGGPIFASQISLGFKRINLFEKINDKSRKDGLTGLYLKRYFLQRLNEEMQREKRYRDGFYVLMLDLDYFKKINDKYGHLFGDTILAYISSVILASVRPGDLVGRYGGEEFIILTFMANVKEVRCFAKKVKNSIESIIFEKTGEKFNINVSMGVSCSSKKAENANFIISTADEALYKAKRDGRSQIVLYDNISH